MKERDIARLCHEEHRAVNELHGRYHYPVWDDAPEHMRLTRLIGVIMCLSNPRMTARDRHRLWLITKMAQGWRLGDRIDIDRKIHSSLVPWSQLSDFDKAKNQLHINNVRRYTALLPRHFFFQFGAEA